MDWDESVRAHIRDLFPGCSLEAVSALAADAGSGGETDKAFGYGRPLRVRLRDASGGERELVVHAMGSDPYGHDRRADRVAAAVLAFDSFAAVPRHVAAIDVGMVTDEGLLCSLGRAREPYLVTEYARGREYAEDLRRIAHDAAATGTDRARCELLADYLAALHAERVERAGAYRRAVRDLVGHGEGIFGIVDGYPDDVPGASLQRLAAIEHSSVTWRRMLRSREQRLTRIHGDFHPFNILFDAGGELALLDASRGCLGDPADDVVCLAVNYVFFALAHRPAWPRAMRELWHRFWERYLTRSGDDTVLEVAPPYLAWRALVLANPAWYPAVTPHHRDRLLRLAETSLERGSFDPDDADEVFA